MVAPQLYHGTHPSLVTIAKTCRVSNPVATTCPPSRANSLPSTIRLRLSVATIAHRISRPISSTAIPSTTRPAMNCHRCRQALCRRMASTTTIFRLTGAAKIVGHQWPVCQPCPRLPHPPNAASPTNSTRSFKASSATISIRMRLRPRNQNSRRSNNSNRNSRLVREVATHPMPLTSHKELAFPVRPHHGLGLRTQAAKSRRGISSLLRQM